MCSMTCLTDEPLWPLSLNAFTDLRWNNIGLLGGRSLLKALQKNMDIVKLEMAGNNIPSDTLRALSKKCACGNVCALPFIYYSKRNKTVSRCRPCHVIPFNLTWLKYYISVCKRCVHLLACCLKVLKITFSDQNKSTNTGFSQWTHF